MRQMTTVDEFAQAPGFNSFNPQQSVELPFSVLRVEISFRQNGSEEGKGDWLARRLGFELVFFPNTFRRAKLPSIPSSVPTYRVARMA